MCHLVLLGTRCLQSRSVKRLICSKSFLSGWEDTGLKAVNGVTNAETEYGCQPKNRGYPKMDGENNGKPENPIKMDDLGVPLFLETPIFDIES